MRWKQIILIPALAALAMMCAGQAGAPTKPYTFFTVDIPGSLSTTVYGINSNREIVGGYETPFPPEFGLPTELRWWHGFVLKNGTLTRVDAPQAVLTQLRGINDQGDVVGGYIPFQNAGTPGGGFRGLLIKNGAQPTSVDFRPKHLNTVLVKITSNGTIVGCYHDEGIDSGPQDSMHGIHIDRKGKMLAIDDEVPGVQYGSGMYTGTTTDGERMAGFWWDHNRDKSRGFEIIDGNFVPFDVPASLYTQAWDMNTRGDVVGIYGDGDVVANPQLHGHGFLKSNGVYQSIEFPNAIDTRAYGLNTAQDIVGAYITADGRTHGFVAIQQPFIGSDPGNRTSFKLPADMRGAKTVMATLSPISNSIRFVRPTQAKTILAAASVQAPACHHSPLATMPKKAASLAALASRGRTK